MTVQGGWPPVILDAHGDPIRRAACGERAWDSAHYDIDLPDGSPSVSLFDAYTVFDAGETRIP